MPKFWLLPLLLAVLMLTAPGSRSVAGDTAKAGAAIVGWRGDGTGCYPQATPVLTWNEEKKVNILWRAAVGEGMNYSCPIVVGDFVLVSAEKERLLCLDRKTGKILWTVTSGLKDLPGGDKIKEFNTSCGYSTPTATSDGQHVYVVYGTGIVASYDLKGKRQWIKHFPFEQATEDGRSASPLLVDGKLIVSLGHIFALDVQTGKIAWEAKDSGATYGSPVAAMIGDTRVAITPRGTVIRVRDGKVLAPETGVCEYASPVVFNGLVFFVGGFGEAYKLPEKVADKMEFKLAYDVELEGDFYASPLYYDGLLYCACNEGILFVVDAKTGEKYVEKKLEIPSAGGGGGEEANIYPSITLVGKHIVVGNDAGYWLVLEPGKEYKEVAKNVLGAGSGACPVPAGKRLYLRGGESLYCIGAK